ncbi:MAG: class II aldolase/adducin family protein [Anaerolineae bacterium]|nr:class II aldolase/adducin family protein [Anaerolineae bacterium]
MPDDVLSQLVTLSRHLADPAHDYVILGEGNTSARADEETFWVKASGRQMDGIEADGFVHVRFAPVLGLLEASDLSDGDVKAELEAARVDPAATSRPSVETVLHALALQLEGVSFVGHTHPTAVNAILCSQRAEEAIAGRLFPDEIVVCGPAPAYVPYTDPGLPLARAVREALQAHMAEWGEPPKVILMQNHGLIALGRTAQEVENITAMYVKTARVIIGTYALGGPRFLGVQAVERIHTRPDELYRRRNLEGQRGGP